MRWQLSLEAFQDGRFYRNKVCVYRSSKRLWLIPKTEKRISQQPLEQKTDNKIQRCSVYYTAGSGGGLYPEGQKQTKETIDYYMENAKIIKQGLEDIGLTVFTFQGGMKGILA